MIDSNIWITYQLIFLIGVIYFVVLGCFMLARRGDMMSTHGEQVAKLRMTRTMGVAMFVWAFEIFIYLPPMLFGYMTSHSIYDTYFLVVLMMNAPLLYIVMFAVVQRKVNIFKWTCGLCLPFLILVIWQIVAPPKDNILSYVGGALSIAITVSLLVRYASEYRNYVRRIKSEYSEISRREILWSWICFSALSVQSIVFVVFQFTWTPLFEMVYILFSLINSATLAYSTCKQTTIDIDVVDDSDIDADVDADSSDSSEITHKPDDDKNDDGKEKVLYAVIEKKLETHCEGQFLYLEPDLTREQLCRHISVSSTYLKLYFRHRSLSFYQYINNLRVEYAYKLMLAHPEMPISAISEQSGFRSQTTFRKMFQEIMGCRPSDLKRGMTALKDNAESKI